MDKFSDIIGQDIIVSHLQNALQTGGVSHAYILNGAKGSGRHMIARSFSAALLCENPQIIDMDAGDPQGAGLHQAGNPQGAGHHEAVAPQGTEHPEAVDPYGAELSGSGDSQKKMPSRRILPRGRLLEPCGECLSCIQAAAGSNPDILIPAREKESSFGVNDIRKIRADVQVKPYRASHKVYILEDAEKMTPAAQNALLKTLEEPPGYAVILLLADGTAGFLPTIMSRCVTLPLRPVAEKAVEDCLMDRFGADPDRARLCARFSGGSIGRAAQLLDNEKFAALREKTISFMRKIDQKDAAEIAAFAKEAAAEDETQDLIDFVLTWNRDLMVCRSTMRTENLIFTDEVQYIIEAVTMLSWQGLQSASEAVFRARRRLFSNVNPELTLQMMLLEIRAAYRRRETPQG